MKRRTFLRLAAGAAPIFSGIARAQTYPVRPITMVVPFAAGGASDLMGRVLAPGLSDALGAQVIVENVGGAGGATGVARVAKAAPDGYQFVLGNMGTQAVTPTLYKRPLYDPVADFAPVSLLAESYYVLITRKDFPAATLPEFISYVKANQSKLQFASAGPGSTTHLVCLLLNSALGVDTTHVPYRSTAVALPDLMAGRIDYVCDTLETIAPQIQAGAVKAIAVLGAGRTSLLPKVPSAVEQGLTGFAVSGWYALFFPHATPQLTVDRLSRAASSVIDAPAVSERLQMLGITPVSPERRTPQYLAKFLQSEIQRWAGPVRASGISIE
jgi:tripartite-type tricarboxylate transporter receptor subunit TctC